MRDPHGENTSDIKALKNFLRFIVTSLRMNMINVLLILVCIFKTLNVMIKGVKTN